VRDTLRRHRLLMACVLLPNLLAIGYLGLVAAPQFASEARFVVRTNSKTGALALGTALSGFVRAADDTFPVHAYILSRDAALRLSGDPDLRDALSRPEADFLFRYPGLFRSPTGEGFFRHYLRFVDVDYDDRSGISTLKVRAFRPEDSQAIAEALLRGAESLINRLNERARQDALAIATRVLTAAERRVEATQGRLTAFREREAITDPAKLATLTLELVARLYAEAAQEKARLAEMSRLAPGGPQISASVARIAALERQIADERRRIGGTDDGMAAKLSEYETLLLERELAQRSLASAFTSLEAARLDAQRQTLYLERVVQPNLADRASHPRQLSWSLFVFGMSLAVFVIVRLVGQAIMDHDQPWMPRR
jgi:capsular polysaccharide transport system permease protein